MCIYIPTPLYFPDLPPGSLPPIFESRSKRNSSPVCRRVEASCQLVSSQLPYEFTDSRGFEWKAALYSIPERTSNHVTENSSRKKQIKTKNYIFNVKTNGASRTSQSIGCLQVLFYFVTVKRFHTHSRAVGSLVDCPKTQ